MSDEKIVSSPQPVILSFSLISEVIPFEMRHPSKGNELFVLIELDGAQRDRYFKEMAKRVDVDPSTGKAGKVKEIEGLQGLVLVFSARRVGGIRGFDRIPTLAEINEKKIILNYEDLTLTPVEMSEVQSWPSRAQGILAEEASKLNGLDKKAKEEAKK